MDTDSAIAYIRSLDGDRYDDATVTRIAPYLAVYLGARPALRALDLGGVANALVLPAGGRK
jgi:hypothetical protein